MHFWAQTVCAFKCNHDANIYSGTDGTEITLTGKPQQNAYIESFNGKFRDECLNEHWFLSMRHARQVSAAWRQEYNDERPHSSLAYLTPRKFAESFLIADSMSISD
jgi:putative transposase